jgi:tetratricopeptide (TPR) repeat protein
MSQEEKLEFENQLQNDADIKQKFEIYKETNQFLATKFSQQTLDFKKNLDAIAKEHFAEKEHKKTKVIAFKPWQYAVAASIAILFGTWFMMQENSDYSEFYQHENANLVERGSIIKNLKAAQEAFNAKNYKVAIENFEIVLKDYDKPEVRFLYGISLLEENRFADAEATFTKLQSGTSIYKDKATYNLALSKLKQKQLVECKMYLKQIPEDAEDYEKAQKLLKKIN